MVDITDGLTTNDDGADGGVRKDGEEKHQSIHTSQQSQSPQPEELKTQTPKKQNREANTQPSITTG